MRDMYECLEKFLTTRIDRNIANIVNKAKQYKDFIMKVLFEEDVEFNIEDEKIRFLYQHGAIDEEKGMVTVKVPLYKMKLIRAFKPIYNSEKRHFPGLREDFNQYFTPQGKINMKKLLDRYRGYAKRRGYKAFDTEQFREGAGHYSLDGFISL
jgi:hypothetical protein